MTRREILIVRAGERWLGVFAEETTGVERGRAAATPLPHAPAAVMGVVSVRGRILTLLDPLVLLKERPAAAAVRRAPAFILALRGEEQLALAVDSSERLREIRVDEIKPPAAGAEMSIACGTFQDDGASVIVLDVARLFAAVVEGMEQRRRRRIMEDENAARRIRVKS